jgi:biopolymer transport protein ExbB
MDIMDMESLFQKYVVNGGVLMWVLVPCSLLMVGAVLQGMIVLRRGRVLPRWVGRLAAEARDENARRQFFKKLRLSESPLARIVWLTLKETVGGGRLPERAELQTKLEDSIVMVSDKMYDMVGVLSTIYTIGPLLGLIGTNHGLMEVFHSYGAMEHPSVQMLSVGVQKALVTTFCGLSMAIPAFVAGQWMQKRIWVYERDLFPEQAWKVIDTLFAVVQPQLEESNEAPKAGTPVTDTPGQSTLVALIAPKPVMKAESEA